MASSGQAKNRDEKSREHFPSLLPLGQHAGKPAIVLSRPVMVAGNSKAVRIQLQSDSVSHNHTIFIIDDSGTYFRDLGSRTHTIVNGKIAREGFLKDGDSITIGSFAFQFVEPSAGGRSRKITPPVAALDIVGVEIPLPFDGPTTVIGRRMGSDVRLTEESVSTSHAIIFEQDGKHHIRDLTSRTGTFVNGRKAHQTDLNFGDEIRIGETTMRFVPYVPEPEEPVTLLDEGSVELTDQNAETATIEAQRGVSIHPFDVAEASESVAPIEARRREPTAEPARDHDVDDEPVVPVARRTPISPRSIDVPSEVVPLAPYPIDEVRIEEDSIPVEDTPVHDAPVAETPVDVAPVDETPVQVEPIEEVPVEEDREEAVAVEESRPFPPEPEVEEVTPIEAESGVTEDDLLELLSDDKTLETEPASPVIDEVAPVIDEVAPVDEVAEKVEEAESEKAQAKPAISPEMDRLLRSLNEAANRPLDPEIAELEKRAPGDLPREEVDLKVEDPLAGVPQPISALARRARAIADLLDVNEDIEQAAEEEAKAIADILTPTDEAAPSLEAMPTDEAAPEPAKIDEAQPIEEAEEPEELVLDSERPVTAETFESEELPLEPAEAEDEIDATRIAIDLPKPAHREEPVADEIDLAEADLRPNNLDEIDKPAIAIEHHEDELHTLIESLETPLAGAIEATTEEPPEVEAHTGPEDDELEAVTLEAPPPIEESLREAIPLEEVEAPVDEADLAPVDREDEAPGEPLITSMDQIDRPVDVVDEETSTTPIQQTVVPPNENLVDLIVESMDETSIEPKSPSLESVMDLAEIDQPISPEAPPVEIEPVAPVAQAPVVAEPVAEAEPVVESKAIDAKTIVEPERPVEVAEKKIEPRPQKKSISDAWEEATSFASQALAPIKPAPKAPAPPKKIEPGADEPKLEGWDDLPEGDLTDSLLPGTGGFMLGGTGGGGADANFLNLGGIGFIGDESDEYEQIPGGIPIDEALKDRSASPKEEKSRAGARRRRRRVEPTDDGSGETLIEPPAPKAELPDWPELEAEIEEPTFPAQPTPTLKPSAPVKPERVKPEPIKPEPVVDRAEPDAPSEPQAPVEPQAPAVIPPRPAISRTDSPRAARRGQAVTPGAMAYPAAPPARLSSDVFSQAPVAGLDEMLSRLPRPGAGTTDQPVEESAREQAEPEESDHHDDDDIDSDGGATIARSEPPRRPMIPRIVAPTEQNRTEHVAEIDPEELVEDATYANQVDPASPPARRKAVRQIPLVVLTMFVMMAAAMVAIYRFVPVPAVARAEFRYNHLSLVPEEVRQSFIGEQKSRMAELREPATGRLPSGISPGFLQSGIALEPVVRSFKPVSGRVDSMSIEVASDVRTLRADSQRLKALAESLYEKNQDVRASYEKDINRLGSIDMNMTRRIAERDELKEEVARLGEIIEDRPGSIELRDMERARNDAQAKLNDTRSAVERQQAKVQQIEKELGDAEKAVADPQTLSDQPDAEVADLEAQIARENQALSELSGPVKASEDARAQLETALDAFAGEVETARQSLADQPDVAAYIEDAQKLLASIRERTDLMSRRQEQWLTRLDEFRQQLSELTDDQQVAKENGDPQLKDMRDQLAFQQRMLNVAQEQNATDSVNEITARIKLLESGIAARRELLADPKVAALKQKLEEMIKATEREMIADRTGNEKFLSDMTSAFIARQPALEKMPDDQQALAQNLADRLASITLARQAYSRALDDSSSADQSRRVAIKTRIGELQLALANRQQEIEDARLSATQLAGKVDSLRTSLADSKNTLAELQEMNAANEVTLKSAEDVLRAAEHRRDLADLAAPEYDTKRTRWLELQKQIETAERERLAVSASVSNGIQPLPLTDDAISTEEEADNRLIIAVISTVVILALGISYLLFILGRGSRQREDFANDPAAQGMRALRV